MSEKITLQKIFDLAWQAFIVEDKPPAYDRGCCYMAADGRRCVIGLALPDSLAAKLGNRDVSFSNVVSMYPDEFDASILKLDPVDLDTFQAALHDDLIYNITGNWLFNVDERRASYIKTAKLYGLQVPKEKE